MADFLVEILVEQAIRVLADCFIATTRWVNDSTFALLQKMNFRDPRKLLEGTTLKRETCVARCSILFRRKSRPTQVSSLDDFLLRRRPDLSSLSILLEKDVSLYSLTPDFAVFVRTPTHINCYSSKTSPFFYMAQFSNAEEVYVTPLSWFSTLSREMAGKDFGTRVTWLSNTGRCGSTMLTQIMEAVPDTVCISEPDAILNIVMFRKLGQFREKNSVLENTIDVLLYHAANQAKVPPNHVFIKVRSECSGLIKDVRQLRPDIRHVFMYRRLSSLLKSMKRLSSELRMPWLMLVNSDLVASITPYFRRSVFDQEFYGTEDERKVLADLVPWMSYIGILLSTIGSHLRSVRALQSVNHQIPVLLYEDILDKPVQTVGSLFDYLKLPRNHLERALQCMTKRSQREIPALCSRSHSSSTDLTDRERYILNKILSIFWLPEIDVDIAYDNRIG